LTNKTSNLKRQGREESNNHKKLEQTRTGDDEDFFLKLPLCLKEQLQEVNARKEVKCELDTNHNPDQCLDCFSPDSLA